MAAGMMACMAFAFLHLLHPDTSQASYGRYISVGPAASSAWHVNARLAWCLQELPSLLWPLRLASDKRALVWSHAPNFVLWALFVFH